MFIEVGKKGGTHGSRSGVKSSFSTTVCPTPFIIRMVKISQNLST